MSLFGQKIKSQILNKNNILKGLLRLLPSLLMLAVEDELEAQKRRARATIAEDGRPKQFAFPRSPPQSQPPLKKAKMEEGMEMDVEMEGEASKAGEKEGNNLVS